MHEAVPAIAACGVSPLVRIPDLQSWMIKSESSVNHRDKQNKWRVLTMLQGPWTAARMA